MDTIAALAMTVDSSQATAGAAALGQLTSAAGRAEGVSTSHPERPQAEHQRPTTLQSRPAERSFSHTVRASALVANAPPMTRWKLPFPGTSIALGACSSRPARTR